MNRDLIIFIALAFAAGTLGLLWWETRRHKQVIAHLPDGPVRMSRERYIELFVSAPARAELASGSPTALPVGDERGAAEPRPIARAGQALRASRPALNRNEAR